MNTQRLVPVAYLMLRLAAGLMFFQTGAMKIFGWFGGMPGANGATASLTTQVGIGGLLEVVGGILIMLGLFTRISGFILSGEMAVAYWQFHAPNGAWPVLNGGVSAALYCFVFLFMAAYGGGEFSIDTLIRRRRQTAAAGAKE